MPDPSSRPPDSVEVDRTHQISVEQYKVKVADLGNIGSRQMSVMTYYVSIISAFLGVLAFKEKSLYDLDAAVLGILCFAGVLVCVLWFFSLSYFRGIFRVKLRVLGEIEETLPHQTFAREFELMQKSALGTWIWIERILPVVFALFFLALVAIRLVKLWG